MNGYPELIGRPTSIDYGTLANLLDNDKLFPCDIDGIFEVNGNFLYLETKFHDGEVPFGQMLLLKRLAKVPGFTVLLVVIDEKTTTMGAYAFLPRKIMKVGVDTGYRPITLDVFRMHYKNWYENARSHPRKEVL